MPYTTPFFQKKTTVFAGGLLLISYLVTFCTNEPIDEPIDPIENPVDTVPPATVWDTLLGEHFGVCYYHYKNYSTNVDEWDTTFNSVIELSRVDSISNKVIQVQGCGPNPFYFFIPPENLDTIYYHHEAGPGGNSWQIKINPFNRTIVTTHSLYWPSPMNIREYTGRWEY